MLLRKIEALRKEPKAVRNRYAFGAALSATLLIAVIWGVSLPSRFSDVANVSVNENQTEESFTEQLSELRNLVGEGVDDIKTQAEALSSAVETQNATTSTSTSSASTGSSTNPEIAPF